MFVRFITWLRALFAPVADTKVPARVTCPECGGEEWFNRYPAHMLDAILADEIVITACQTCDDIGTIKVQATEDEFDYLFDDFDYEFDLDDGGPPPDWAGCPYCGNESDYEFELWVLNDSPYNHSPYND